MRKFFQYFFRTIAALVLIASAALLYARFVEPNLLIRKNLEIAAPQSVRPIKVALFSDTHFGVFYKEKELEKIVKKINDAQPDIVLFAGDLIDSYNQHPPDLLYLQEQLAQIQAPHGKYAVFGNHDYGGGAHRVYQGVMEAGGFEVLINETATIEALGVSVAGADDFYFGSPDFELGNQMPADTFNLLLSHEPEPATLWDNTNVDLILSGHTHGGQVYIPFLPHPILSTEGRKYRKGLFTLPASQTQLFVTSGIGTTKMPLRFLNIPEVIIFELG